MRETPLEAIWVFTECKAHIPRARDRTAEQREISPNAENQGCECRDKKGGKTHWCKGWKTGYKGDRYHNVEASGLDVKLPEISSISAVFRVLPILAEGKVMAWLSEHLKAVLN